jgi:hypothetical protein
LQTFFFGVRCARERIHAQDHTHLVDPELDPPDEGATNLALARPCQRIEVLRHRGRKRIQAPHHELEFPPQRCVLGELSTWGCELGHAVP